MCVRARACVRVRVYYSLPLLLYFIPVFIITLKCVAFVRACVLFLFFFLFSYTLLLYLLSPPKQMYRLLLPPSRRRRHREGPARAAPVGGCLPRPTNQRHVTSVSMSASLSCNLHVRSQATEAFKLPACHTAVTKPRRRHCRLAAPSPSGRDVDSLFNIGTQITYLWTALNPPARGPDTNWTVGRSVDQSARTARCDVNIDDNYSKSSTFLARTLLHR